MAPEGITAQVWLGQPAGYRIFTCMGEAEHVASQTPDQKAMGKSKRPHGWTIGLSIGAIAVSLVSAVVSLLSWSEARGSRRVNEASSRAYVSVSSVLLDTRVLYRHPKPQFRYLTGYLTITNTGRVLARQLQIDYAVMSQSTDVPMTREDGGIAHVSDFRELAPGSSATVRFNMPVRSKNNSFDRREREFTLNLSFSYNDGLHSGSKVDSISFCAPVPAKLQAELLQFYRCNETVEEIANDGKPIRY